MELYRLKSIVYGYIVVVSHCVLNATPFIQSVSSPLHIGRK